jgi:hypothetical protein
VDEVTVSWDMRPCILVADILQLGGQQVLPKYWYLFQVSTNPSYRVAIALRSFVMAPTISKAYVIS